MLPNVNVLKTFLYEINLLFSRLAITCIEDTPEGEYHSLNHKKMFIAVVIQQW